MRLTGVGLKNLVGQILRQPQLGAPTIQIILFPDQEIKIYMISHYGNRQIRVIILWVDFDNCFGYNLLETVEIVERISELIEGWLKFQRLGII